MGDGQEVGPDPRLFFVQDTRPAPNRHCATFERAGRLGYTSDLHDAGRFTFDEAAAIVRGGDRRAFPCGDVMELARFHVDTDRLDRLHREAKR